MLVRFFLVGLANYALLVFLLIGVFAPRVTAETCYRAVGEIASDREREMVLVAKQDLVAGARVKVSDFSTISLPRKYVEDQYIRAYDEIKDLYLKASVTKNTIVNFNLFSRGRGLETIQFHIPVGSRAVEARVISSKALNVGDRITIRWFDSNNLNTDSNLLGIGIEVLNVSFQTASETVPTLLLAASPEVVNRILLARLNGELVADVS